MPQDAASFGLYFKGMNQKEANGMRGRLNQVAAACGYFAERGPTSGEGNFAALLQAIDAGEMLLVVLPNKEYKALNQLIDEANKKEDNEELSLVKNLIGQARVRAEWAKHRENIPVLTKEAPSNPEGDVSNLDWLLEESLKSQDSKRCVACGALLTLDDDEKCIECGCYYGGERK